MIRNNNYNNGLMRKFSHINESEYITCKLCGDETKNPKYNQNNSYNW